MATWAYDFGTPTSPVAAGYTQVTQETRFSTTNDYGVTSKYVQSRERSLGTSTTRDMVVSETGSLAFAKALPAGTYDVTITAGDSDYKRTEAVWLEGQWVETLSTARGEFAQRTYRTSVTDGRLTLELRGVNGSGYAYINAVTITTVDAPPPTPPPSASGSLARFDFGTPTSAVQAGYTQVVGKTSYSSTLGYGWTTPAQGQVRSGGDALKRDFGFSSTGLLGFAVDLPDGWYDVTLTMGDPAYARAQSVVIEGQLQETIAIPRGQVWDRQYRVQVADGRMNVQLRGAAGNPVAVLNGMTVTAVAAGDTTLLTEDFEDANLPSRGWYDGKRFALGNDATTGSRSLQYSFLTGSDTPYDSDVLRHLFPGTESVYISFDLKLSADWTWSASGPHLFYFLTNADDSYKGPAATHLTLYTQPDAGYMQVAAQDNLNVTMPHGTTQQVSPSTNYRKFLSADPVLTTGQWHHVEAYFQLNSLDMANDRPNPDGVMRAWVDGQMVVDQTSVILRTTDFPTMKINQLLIGPYYHVGVPHDQALWIDNLSLATAPPATATAATTTTSTATQALSTSSTTGASTLAAPLTASSVETSAWYPGSPASVPDPQRLSSARWGRRAVNHRPIGP